MPSLLPPFRIQAWAKNFARMFPIGDPASISVTPRHLALGTGNLVLPVDHHRVPALMQPGVRLTFDYYVGPAAYSDPAGWTRLMSGPIRTLAAAGPVSEGAVTFGIESDFRLLSQVLAWPVPANAIGSQTAAYDKRSGACETILKAYVAANAVTRLGLPITIGPNLARGATRSASARYDSLADLLVPLATLDGLGISLVQDDTTQSIVFDVYTPTDRTARVLSEAAGTITDWSFSRTAPAATEAIVGGPGDGTARTVRKVVNTGRETTWGMKAELFVDGTSADTSAELDQAGAAALVDADATSGVSVSVAETDVVRYGRNLFVGDKVAVAITDDFAITDVLSSATVSWTAESGVTVEPAVGDSSGESVDAHMAKAISRAFTAIRSLRSSR